MKKDRLIKNGLKAIKALATRSMILETACIPLRFANLPYKRIFNAIRVGMSIFMKSAKPWGWPPTLQIEPASLCNIQCDLCPVTEGMDRPTGLMDLKLFKKIIDEAGDYVLLIVLWDWGEPFVNPAVYDMIAYAKKRNIGIISSTNAQLFADEKNAEKLVMSGIDSIIVAIDGIHQDTYERFRQKGKLETALSGVGNIVAARTRLHSQTPLITFRFIVTKYNENEIPELKELVGSLGVDILSIKTLSPFHFYKGNDSDKLTHHHALSPRDEKYRRFKYTGQADDRQRIKRKPSCTRFWDCMTIHWDGTVPLCTYDYNDTWVIGDLKTDSVKNLWFGAPINSIRRKFVNDWEEIELCRNCTNSYEGGACDRGETVVEVMYRSEVADLFSSPEHPEKVNMF